MAGIDTNTKLYLPLNEYSNDAVTCNGALEVLDCGTGANVITQVSNAAYQTSVTKVWNAAVDLNGSSDYLQVDGLTSTFSNVTVGTISFWLYMDTIS